MVIIGIDIGGTNIDIGITDNNGRIIKSGFISTRAKRGPEACMNTVVAKIRELIKKCNISMESIEGNEEG